MPINPSEANFFNGLHSNSEKSNNKSALDIDQIRENIKKLSSFVEAPAEIKFEDINIPSKEQHTIRLRYYHATNDIKPLIIFFPGNGFVYNLFEENHSIISKIAKKSGCHAVMIEYRLAPEHPYPAQLSDAVESVNYIYSNIKKFNADKNKVILAGYSSGANIVAVITNMIHNNKSTPIFHQLLISGAYDYTNSLHDYDEFGIQDKLLSPDEAQFSFNAYCKEHQRKDPSCSPYWEKDLSGLPPTTIIVAEYDGGRSQSEGYAKKLIEAGNMVRKVILTGQTHGTIMYRKALSDGKDPAIVVAEQIMQILK